MRLFLMLDTWPDRPNTRHGLVSEDWMCPRFINRIMIIMRTRMFRDVARLRHMKIVALFFLLELHTMRDLHWWWSRSLKQTVWCCGVELSENSKSLSEWVVECNEKSSLQSNDELTCLLSASHVWKSAQKRGDKYVHRSVGGLCVFYAINCREERLGDKQKLGAAHCRLWLLPLIFRYMPCLYWHTGIKVICQRREGRAAMSEP